MRRFARMQAAATAISALALMPATADASRIGTTTPFPCSRVAAPGYCGDAGPALRAGLSLPVDVAALPDGGYVIADAGNDAVRAVAPDGRITTLAGGERAGVHLRLPSGVATDAAGRVLVADTGDNRVLVLQPSGAAYRIAGDGVAGRRGDGGFARLARLSAPAAVASAADGAVFVADTGNNRVRRIDADGTITTVARIPRPVDVAALRDGSVLIAEGGGQLHLITADGTVGLVPVHLGDDPAIAPLADGGAVASSPANGRVVRLLAGSFASRTVAASRCANPVVAVLHRPAGLSATPDGEFLVADTAAHRIVRLADGRAKVVAGAGLLVPDRACTALGAMPDPPDILARLRADRVGTDRDYLPPPPGGRPPTCDDRFFWTFQLRFRFMLPRTPRARQTFALYYSSSRRVRIQLTLRRAGLTRRFPRRSVVTRHSQFAIVVLGGVRRAGRYRTRLVATAGARRECVDKTIRIRKRRR
jgi:DNA-binding beta-propeller fold protein YncE